MSIIQGTAVTGAGDQQYQISRSLRFNSADTAYLNRTPSSTTDRRKFTYSTWVKRAALGTFQTFIAATDSSTQDGFLFRDNNTIQINFNDITSSQLVTTQVFRDVSAWYHLVMSVDTTQATASNRIKLYVNGVQVTAFSTANYPSQNYDTFFNTNTYLSRIGYSGLNSNPADMYMTEINFIDGQALTPTDFGEFNSDTGVWQPIEYTGTYGTNGFYLNFSDNTSTTTLGDDFSGNGNDWTTNNFSVTAGAGNDSLVDSPTRYGTDTGAGGEVRGNYCTFNPLVIRPDATPNKPTLSEGNLKAVFPDAGGNVTYGTGTHLITSGKYYWEITLNSVPNNVVVGVATQRDINGTNNDLAMYAQGGGIFKYGSQVSTGASFTNNDVLGIAYDGTNGTIAFYKNNSLQGTITGLTIQPVFPYTRGDQDTLTGNFGQRPFAYTAPSGFKALVTTNLPEPTVADGGEYFNTVLYTGTGANLSVTGVGFQPSFVWIKSRSAGQSHSLYDAVRGATKQLNSNNTGAEGTYAGVSSFDADGFSVGTADNNTASATYVAWNWKANGAGVSNTAGTITSTVSVNTTSGFSIVTYTGTGSAATVGHGLGAVPRMIIVKNRDQADAWQVYHAANTAAPETDYLVLNTTAATADNADRWNDTLPTSTVFSIGNGVEVNTNTEKYVAYVFAQIAGYSAFGSYTGNGSADGPFVYTGFRPKFIMRKQTTDNGDVGGWIMFDTSRDLFNVATKRLLAQSSNAEVTPGNNIDILSNGWKERSSDGYTNASGQTFIYMAFAENPFSIALAR